MERLKLVAITAAITAALVYLAMGAQQAQHTTGPQTACVTTNAKD